MNKQSIINKTAKHVRAQLEGETTGHDWWHVYRVWKMAIIISKYERGVDTFIVQLAALLHDIADWKFHGGDDSVGPKLAIEWLRNTEVDDKTISHVAEIIKEVSFKGAGVKSRMRTKEGMVVQDADRLDALGAIGIARTFATGAKLDLEIYNPKIKPKLHKTFEEYKSARFTSINHFYEKLLLLKDRMNTSTARKIAKSRHAFMERFLKEFYNEWEVRDVQNNK